jgi:hypothetical protein
MDKKSHGYGIDNVSANMMNMLTRAKKNNKKMTPKQKMKLINTWLW